MCSRVTHSVRQRSLCLSRCLCLTLCGNLLCSTHTRPIFPVHSFAPHHRPPDLKAQCPRRPRSAVSHPSSPSRFSTSRAVRPAALAWSRCTWRETTAGVQVGRRGAGGQDVWYEW
jgi:hypothetical protein